jgi:protein-S-isoprenylcysteine O-methyltransferase
MVHPLPFVWPIGIAFWLAYVWAFLPEIRLVRRAAALPAARRSQDAGSLRVIVHGNQLAVIAAVSFAFILQGASIRADRMPLYWLGVLLVIAGSALRRHCFRMLGAQFTGAVQVEPGQRVIDHGAYRWIRHPSYTAALVIFAGMGFALGNWWSVVVLIVAPATIYAYRVAVEERALRAVLGASYEGYMRRTRRFIPFVL